MGVRCKFYVRSKTAFAGSDGVSLEMSPVPGTSEENKTFFKSTPSGEVKFYTINKEAADQLELGKEYYIDFTPA